MAGITEIALKNIDLGEFCDSPVSRVISEEAGIYKICPSMYETFKIYHDILFNSRINYKKVSHKQISYSLDPSDTKDISISVGSMRYAISLNEDDSMIMSEAIINNGNILIYRDQADIINYKATRLVDVEPERLKELTTYPGLVLSGICSQGWDMYQGIFASQFIDVGNSRDMYEAEREIQFDNYELELINNIFPKLFNGVHSVNSNGSYQAGASGRVKFGLNEGGGGYRNLIALAWKYCKVSRKGGTLFVNNWSNGLHPILKNALKEIMLKSKMTEYKGTLFIATYED